MIAYLRQMNTNANARDYLVQFTQRLLISTSNSIQLQSASLVHLTQAIHQLTRTTTVSCTLSPSASQSHHLHSHRHI